MELVSLVVGVISVGFSVYAVYVSKTARNAVNEAMRNRNTQDDLGRLRELIILLHEAKSAVTPWIAGGSSEARAGRAQQTDLATLTRAIDVLRTKAPLDAPASIKSRITRSAKILDEQFRNIAEGTTNEDCWKNALSELQLIIPKLEQFERQVRDAQV